MSATEDLR